MTTEEIVSKAANNVGDIGFEFMTKKEYIDLFNDTMLEIVKKCGTFYDMIEVEPTPDTSTYTFESSDVVKIVRLEYIENDGYPIPFREVAFSRVMDRSNLDTYPLNTIPDVDQFYDGDGNVVLEIPKEQTTGGSVRTGWYATRVNNGIFTLFFSFNFKENDKLKIWYNKQWTKHLTFDNTDISWDGYQEALLEGMRWRALRIMQYRPTAQQRQSWEYKNEIQISMDLYYRQLIPEIKRYIWDLKTVQDAVRIAPFKYP